MSGLMVCEAKDVPRKSLVLRVYADPDLRLDDGTVSAVTERPGILPNALVWSVVPGEAGVTFEYQSDFDAWTVPADALVEVAAP